MWGVYDDEMGAGEKRKREEDHKGNGDTMENDLKILLQQRKLNDAVPMRRQQRRR